MKQSDYTITSLPKDVAVKIASCLEEPDLYSLACCSRDCRELFGSDYLWEPLFKERWPHLYEAALEDPDFKGWRRFYMKQHEKMRDQAASVVKFLKQCSQFESLEVTDYLRAIECLKSMQFGFKDVQMLLFKPKMNVLLNLVGLHFCLDCLQVPVVEALQSSKISNRQVCVKWYRGRLFHRMQDEYRSRCVSLEDLVTAKEKEVLWVLGRELLRAKIFILS
ncbi:uncharacterized protein LOC111298564 isoform X2 [Durio zibethinus]|uniref:Uncharacterized protein LOC111298564 isoform X2 n=1 Tax=Durio zibethinus TaxID=66656 RepID=A0A6P5Z918_DURZI|nr:uncharacterized protein LOC111298564 isoform X2 [Durio zibethinus]